jgi:crossover junction endodeoxyribonuclease RuvC
MRILGIDPGSKITGFGLISLKPGHSRFLPRSFEIVEAGVVRPTASHGFNDRLRFLHGAVAELIGRLQPDVCVIEKAFHGVNASSSLKLGEVRGTILTAAFQHNVPTADITPAQVKRLVAGHGAATKEAIAQSIAALLGFNRRNLPVDVCDALAIALTHGVVDASEPAVKVKKSVSHHKFWLERSKHANHS